MADLIGRLLVIQFCQVTKTSKPKPIESFDFNPGRILASKYQVISCVGSGWEGEVYKLRELETGIERAGKFFFPQRNPNNKTVLFHAKKLHKLRHCRILIHYTTQETMRFEGQTISFLVSDYVEGILLSEFIKRHPKKRLETFEALHLLHALASGMEAIHKNREYHGDLHTDNIFVTRFGLKFELKVFDLFQWQAAKRENIQDDVVAMLGIFYEVIDGDKTYAKQPKEVKQIVMGRKRSLIHQKFKTAGQVRLALEDLRLDSLIRR